MDDDPDEDAPVDDAAEEPFEPDDEEPAELFEPLSEDFPSEEEPFAADAPESDDPAPLPRRRPSPTRTPPASRCGRSRRP